MDGLQLANQFWKHECRDDELTRLKKQKHAAHSQVHRLKRRIKELELARHLITVVYLATSHSNDVLRERITKFLADLDEIDRS